MLTIVRGYPGSGKTTLAKSLALPYFEADQYFATPSGEYIFDASRIGDAHNWCYQKVASHLCAGLDVVVSNTFTRIWEMEKYISLANNVGVEYKVVRCIGDYKSIHGVPDDIVEYMKQRMEDYPGEVFI